MSIYNWDSASLGLNIPAIDREHQTLVELMNRVHDLHVANAARDEIWQALAKLSRYTTWHFRNEERYMAATNYLDLSSHRVVHSQLLVRLSAYLRDFDRDGGQLAKDFFDFLQSWVASHIMGIDRQYAQLGGGAKGVI